MNQNPEDREALVFIRLPWTGMVQKKGFDSSLLTAPLQLEIKTRPAAAWWFGDLTKLATTAFAKMHITDREFVLTDQGMSLRDAVRYSLDKFVSLPYQFQSIATEREKVTINPRPQAQQTYELTIRNFINADLTQLAFMVFRDLDYHNSVDSNRPNLRKGASYGTKISDIELFVNGIPLAKMVGDTYSAFMQPLFCGAQGYDVLMQSAFQTKQEDAAKIANLRWYYGEFYQLIMTQKNPIILEDKTMMNSIRYGRMTMTMKFKVFTPITDPGYAGTGWEGKSGATEAETYHFVFMQNYNAGMFTCLYKWLGRKLICGWGKQSCVWVSTWAEAIWLQCKYIQQRFPGTYRLRWYPFLGLLRV